MRDYAEIWVRQYKPGEPTVTSSRWCSIDILNMELYTAIVAAPFANFRYCTATVYLCQVAEGVKDKTASIFLHRQKMQIEFRCQYHNTHPCLILSHQHGWVFLYPYDPERGNIQTLHRFSFCCRNVAILRMSDVNLIDLGVLI